MGVRLRLTWGGMKHRPRWGIVAADARKPRDSGFLEVLGMYDPLPTVGGHKVVRLVPHRIRYWLGVGAQPTPTLFGILKKSGIVDERGKVVPTKGRVRDAAGRESPLMGVAAEAMLKAQGVKGKGSEGYPNLGKRRARREEKRMAAKPKS